MTEILSLIFKTMTEAINILTNNPITIVIPIGIAIYILITFLKNVILK